MFENDNGFLMMVGQNMGHKEPTSAEIDKYQVWLEEAVKKNNYVALSSVQIEDFIKKHYLYEIYSISDVRRDVEAIIKKHSPVKKNNAMGKSEKAQYIISSNEAYNQVLMQEVVLHKHEEFSENEIEDFLARCVFKGIRSRNVFEVKDDIKTIIRNHRRKMASVDEGSKSVNNLSVQPSTLQNQQYVERKKISKENGVGTMSKERIIKPDDDTLRIVALGASGTGKTSYLHGIFEEFSLKDVRKGDLSVRFYNADFDEYLENLNTYFKLRHGLQIKAGTKQKNEYNFDLLLESDLKNYTIPLEIFDYRGGVSDVVKTEVEVSEEVKEEIDELSAYLEICDVVLVLVDSAYAKRYNGDNAIEIKKELCTEFFSNILKAQMNNKECTPKYVQFVLTKWDTLLNEKEKSQAESCVEAIYADVINACRRQRAVGWKYDIMHVQVGDISTSEKRRLENIDTSIIKAIEKSVSIRCDVLGRRYGEFDQEIRRYYELLKCFSLERKERRQIRNALEELKGDKDKYVQMHYKYNSINELITDNA